MKIKDLKYLLAYLTPISCWISLSQSGILSFATLIFLFVVIPIAEQFSKGATSNLNEIEELDKGRSVFFDIILYLNFPILYILLFYYFNLLSSDLSTIDLIGKTLAIGIIIGSIGINVAHEIGHRPNWYNQWISRFMLLPALYMHFNIEHNKGHHKWVATPEDPATSRRGESIYTFWVRTVSQSFSSAWDIECKELQKAGIKILSLSNKIILFVIIQVGAIILTGLFYNWFVAGMFLISAMIGFSMLEAVNYIEHYGLVRVKLASGKYSPVEPRHSWNSNHDLGRILLYELTRHSDHHYKSTRKYQILRHFDDSPQLPYGYPASIVIAAFPKLWFKIMDKRLSASE